MTQQVKIWGFATCAIVLSLVAAAPVAVLILWERIGDGSAFNQTWAAGLLWSGVPTAASMVASFLAAAVLRRRAWRLAPGPAVLSALALVLALTSLPLSVFHLAIGFGWFFLVSFVALLVVTALFLLALARFASLRP